MEISNQLLTNLISQAQSNPETVLLVFGFAIVLYIAYKILKMVFKVLLISLVSGGVYGIGAYTGFVTFDWTILLSVMLLVGIIYTIWRLIQIPAWFIKKAKDLVF